MWPYKGFIENDPTFRLFHENMVLKVGHLYETSFCINKITREEIPIFEFDSDPTCGIAGQYNDWCLIGGELLVLRTLVDNTLWVFKEVTNCFALKAVDAYTTQILTDPWSESSAIWQLTIDLNKFARPLKLNKIGDFKNYVGKPYTEIVEW